MQLSIGNCQNNFSHALVFSASEQSTRSAIQQFLANSGSGSSGASSDASTESPRARVNSPGPPGTENSNPPSVGGQPGSATSSRTTSLAEAVDAAQSGQQRSVQVCVNAEVYNLCVCKYLNTFLVTY